MNDFWLQIATQAFKVVRHWVSHSLTHVTLQRFKDFFGQKDFQRIKDFWWWQWTVCTLHSGLIGGSITPTMTTKDPNDHLKTNHSQLEVFRPCYLQDELYSPRPAPGPQSPGHMYNTQSETSLLFSGPQEGFSCHIL